MNIMCPIKLEICDMRFLYYNKPMDFSSKTIRYTTADPHYQTICVVQNMQKKHQRVQSGE